MIFTASAPATTSNLGPGYDCIGMALGLRCVVSAVASDSWVITHTGEHTPRPDQQDAVLMAAQKVSSDPLRISVDNRIPIGKGLGSSAAALVAGSAAGLLAIGDEAAPDRIYRIAAELEGHSDQVAAAVYGGLVLIPAEGLPMRLPLHPTLRPVLAIPNAVLTTTVARGVVEPNQPLDRVVRTLSRMSALTAGLITGDPEMLAAAHGDEIHEAPRFALSPEVGSLIEVARSAGALHAARSGSGPSVVAMVNAESAEQVAAAFARVGARVLSGPMDTTGLVVSQDG